MKRNEAIMVCDLLVVCDPPEAGVFIVLLWNLKNTVGLGLVMLIVVELGMSPVSAYDIRLDTAFFWINLHQPIA